MEIFVSERGKVNLTGEMNKIDEIMGLQPHEYYNFVVIK